MLGQLDPCGGGDPIPLLKPKLLVGRRSRCDITLQFPNISSHHCELEFVNGYWMVRDLASTNGIKVNGERCESKWLMPGDVLHVAKHPFRIDYEPLEGAPPPPDLEEEDVMAKGLLEKAGLVQSESTRRRRRRSSNDVMAARPARTERRPDSGAGVATAGGEPTSEDVAFELLADDGEPEEEDEGPKE